MSGDTGGHSGILSFPNTTTGGSRYIQLGCQLLKSTKTSPGPMFGDASPLYLGLRATQDGYKLVSL